MKYINFDMLRHLFEVWKEIEEKAGNDKGAYCYNECINVIDKMSSTDVVEVVRCKDCKHKGEYKDGSVKWCDRIPNADFYVDDDFFCKNGERRKTE